MTMKVFLLKNEKDKKIYEQKEIKETIGFDDNKITIKGNHFEIFLLRLLKRRGLKRYPVSLV